MRVSGGFRAPLQTALALIVLLGTQLQALAQPDLVPTSLYALSNSIVFHPASHLTPTVSVSYRIENQGDSEASCWYDRISVSTNGTLDGVVTSDWFLDGWEYSMPAGSSSMQTVQVRLPQQSGTYWLLLQVDPYQWVYQDNPSNNLMVATAPVTLDYQFTPTDLAPLSLTTASNRIAFLPASPRQPEIAFRYAITNRGMGLATEWYNLIILSTNGTLDGMVSSQYFFESGALPAGGTLETTSMVAFPQQGGTYWPILQVNPHLDYVSEYDRSNNVLVGEPVVLDYRVAPADLVPQSFSVLSSNIVLYPPAPQSVSVAVVYTVANQGENALESFSWSDRISVSTNGALDGVISSAEVGIQLDWLAVGAAYQRTNLVTLPSVSGTYWLILQANCGQAYEGNYSNNFMVASVPINLTYEIRPPDLVPVHISVRTNHLVFHPPSPQPMLLSLTYAVSNLGRGNVSDDWYDRVYISTNDTVEGSVSSQDLYHDNALVAGGECSGETTIYLPQKSGTYWLILEANSGRWLYEENVSNNKIVSSPFTLDYQVIPPDLAALGIAPATNQVVFHPNSPQSPTISVFYAVANQGAGPAEDWWHDKVYVSTNQSVNGAVMSQEFDRLSYPAPLFAGGVFKGSATISLPQVSGDYWLIFQANSYNYLYEEDLSNNLAVSSVPVKLNYEVVPPDLVALNVSPSTNYLAYRGSQMPTLPVTFTVKNQGAAAGYDCGYWTDCIYISTNATMGGVVSTQLLFQLQMASLDGTYLYTNEVSFPKQSGTYWIFFEANSATNLYEVNLSNNLIGAAEPVTLNYEFVPPDLVPLSVNPSSNQILFHPTRPQSPTVEVTWAVTNQGGGAASDYWQDVLYISTNQSISGAVATQTWFESWWYSPLLPGVTYLRTNLVTLPQQSGTYWLILQANDNARVVEASQSNNTVLASFPIVLDYELEPPGLTPLAFQAPAHMTSTNTQAVPVTVVWGVTNQGPGTTEGTWHDTVYFSTNSVFDPSMHCVGWYSMRETIPPGGCYWRTNTLWLPVTKRGTYYLFFRPGYTWALPSSPVLSVSIEIEFEFPIGSLQVAVTPEAARSALSWQVDDSAWRASGQTCSNLLAGLHRLTFANVPGLTRPANRMVVVQADTVTTINADYTPTAVVAFADTNLEVAVRSALSKPSGDLTTDDMAQLTELSLPGLGIKSLSGLEWAVNLNSIQASYNAIGDLTPLTDLSNLRSLSLFHNPLTNCTALASLTNLSSLALYYTGFTNASLLTNLTGLSQLALVGNGLTDVSPLAALTNLDNLNLSQNPLLDCSRLSRLTNLTFLYLQGVGLSQIDFVTNFNRLSSLDLGDNRISDLGPLAHLNLYWLMLTKNRITNLAALASLSSLNSVYLGENLLDLSQGSPASEVIRDLKNRRVYVYDFPQHVFDPVNAPTKWTMAANGNSSLLVQVLGNSSPKLIAHNSDTNLLPVSTFTPVGAPDNWGYGWSISLTPRPNQVGTTPLSISIEDDWGLTTNFNIQITVEWATNVAFADPNLERLLCSALGKPLGCLTSADLKNLIYFFADGQNIRSLSGLEGAVNLAGLYLRGNFISDLSPLRFLSRLQYLGVETNGLTEIGALRDLPQIEMINLSGNWLDLSAGAPARDVIGSLTNRHVSVLYDGQIRPQQSDQIGQSLNPALAWVSGGDALWLLQPGASRLGNAAGQSGMLLDNQQSWIQTTLQGPGMLSFWWKVSSETNFDFMEFQVDGVQAASISGDSGWQQQIHPLGPGLHTLTWRFSKDSLLSFGNDCANLAEVAFAPSYPELVPSIVPLPGGGLQLGVSSWPGTVLELQVRTNLSVGDWVPISRLTNSSGEETFFDADLNQPQRFYRVRQVR